MLFVAAAVTLILPVKQKYHYMVLVSLVLVMNQPKNKLIALEILVLFSLKRIGVKEVSQFLRHFAGQRQCNT